MLFYNLTIYFAEKEGEQFQEQDPADVIVRPGQPLHRESVSELLKTTDEYSDNISGKFFFVSDIREDSFSVCIISMDSPVLAKGIKDYLDTIQVKYKDWSLKEIPVKDFENMMHGALGKDYITSDELRFSFHKRRGSLNKFYESKKMKETMFHDTGETVGEVKKTCKKLLSTSLTEEVDRIFSTRVQKSFIGHPVQYMIESDDINYEQRTLDTLLCALYLKNRVASRCVYHIGLSAGSAAVDMSVYECADMGCLVIVMPTEEKDEPLPPDEFRAIEQVARLIKRYQNRVLTICLLPQNCNRMKEVLFQNAQGCTFIEITQDKLDWGEAKDYLSKKVKEHHVKADESLYQRLGDKDQYFSVPDLDGIFESWLSEYLKSTVFPGYSHMSCPVVKTKKEKPIGDAYKELESMVGLTEVKRVINEALDYFKAQKLFRDKGLQESYPVMHMVFAGNPGTAKTTVARLFAQIMKDNGILSKGELIKVSRADLVGRYCGWTAQNVKAAFQEAEGSVLFIDEAYSLLDNQSGHFGDEAIDTIVDEMENHREDVIVILAGYPKEMEQLLDRNPGLRSRIAYHISFPDYSAEELYGITKLQAQENGMQLESSVEGKLIPMLEEAREQKNFGNGRFVRNLVDDAKRKQAKRLLNMEYDDVTTEVATTLQASDFEYIKFDTKERKNEIGFRI